MVFSGIVDEQGTVVSWSEVSDLKMWDGTVGKGWKLVIKCKIALDGAYDGASIAVNGVCLTVTKFDADTFEVGVAPETLRRTNIGDVKPGSKVNLERSMTAEGRNSGHYVQGHVDGTGTIKKFRREGDSLWVTIGDIPTDVMKYIVEKGYISADGTSLTICEVSIRTAYQRSIIH
jgi:riboflavin synthase